MISSKVLAEAQAWPERKRESFRDSVRLYGAYLSKTVSFHQERAFESGATLPYAADLISAGEVLPFEEFRKNHLQRWKLSPPIEVKVLSLADYFKQSAVSVLCRQLREVAAERAKSESELDELDFMDLDAIAGDEQGPGGWF